MSHRDEMIDALLDCVASAPETKRKALHTAIMRVADTGEGRKYINNECTDYYVPLTKQDVECLILVATTGKVRHPGGYPLNKHETMYPNTMETVRQLTGERHWLTMPRERIDGEIAARFVIHNHKTGKFRFLGFDM